MFSYRTERMLRLFTFWIVVSSGVNLLAADDSNDEEMLAKLDLKRAGSVLVVEGEEAVHNKSDTIRQLAGDLSDAVMRQRSTLSQKEYQATLQELNAEISQFRAELNATNATINRIPKSRGRMMNNLVTEQARELNVYKSQVQWEINQRTTVLNQLKSRPFDPKARTKLDVEVQNKRLALQQDAVELRQLVDSAREKYATLAKDPAVKQAQTSLGKQTGAALKLGPSRQFLADVKMLERLEQMVSTGDDGNATSKKGRMTRTKSNGKRKSTLEDEIK